MIERYQLIQNLFGILILVGTILAAISTWGWNHYGNKVTLIKSNQQDSTAENRHDEIISGVEKIADRIDKAYLKSIEYEQLKQNVRDLEKLVETSIDSSEKLSYDFRLQAAKSLLQKFEEDVISLAEVLTTINLSSKRFDSAKELVAVGKFKDANLVLDTAQMSKELDDLMSHDKKFQEMAESRLRELVKAREQLSNEFLLKAKLIELDINESTRLAKAFSFYRKSIDINKNRRNLVQFADFLNRNNYKDAINAYQEALSFLEENFKGELEIISIKRKLGLCFSDRLKFDQAEPMLIQSINLLNAVGDQIGPTDVKLDLANLYTDLANTQYRQGRFPESKVNYEFATKLLRSESSNNINFKHALASNLLNCGITSQVFGQEKATEFSLEAVKLYKELIMYDPQSQIYKAELAKVLTNYGALVRNVGDETLAKQAYLEALSFRDVLYSQNPSVYAEDLAFTLNNLGNLLRLDWKERSMSLNYLNRSLVIRRYLMQLDKERFSDQVAQVLYNISLYHAQEQNYPSALIAIEEVIHILRPLKDKTPAINHFFLESIDLRKKYQVNIK